MLCFAQKVVKFFVDFALFGVFWPFSGVFSRLCTDFQQFMTLRT